MLYSYSTSTKLVRVGMDRLEAREPAGATIMPLLGLFAVIGGIFLAWLYLPSFLTWLYLPSFLAYFGYVVIAVMIVIGLIPVGLILLSRQKVTFDNLRRTVEFRTRPPGLAKKIDFSDIEAIELRPVSWMNMAGRVALALREPSGKRLPIFMRDREAALRDDAALLADFIGVEVRDGRKVLVAPDPLRPDQTLPIEMKCTGQLGAANSRTHKLNQPSPDVLRVAATPRSRIVQLLVFGPGVVVLLLGLLGVVSLTQPTGPDLGAAVLCLTVGGGFTAVSLTLLRCPTVTLDRSTGVMSGGRVGKAAAPARSMPLRQVAAVQIVSGDVSADEGPRFTTYEVNLVVSDPPGRRITLMSHAEQMHIRDDAAKIAEFLSVPLLDHRGAADED